MTKLGAALVIGLVGALVLAQPSSATTTPTPCAAGSACDPQQVALLNAVRQQLGGTLAEALRAENQLDGSLRAAAYEEQQLTTLITASDEKIAALNAQIVQLQVDIDTTNRHIKLERAEIATLARTIYAQPQSMLLVVAESRNLADAMSQTSKYMLAGMNAHRLQVQLQDDLQRLQSSERQLESDRAEQQRQKTAVQSLFGRSITLQSLTTALSDQLQGVIGQINQELAVVGTQSPALAAQLRTQLAYRASAITSEASLVTSEHVQLSLQLPTEARSQVIDWASATSGQLPVHRPRLVWPLANAVLTQGFGPSSLAVEPPMFGYAHFHSGIDLAAAFNTPVVAAADGVVTIAGRDPWGYGNYVVVSHGGGLATLYGHLNTIHAAVGESVVQGQVIGFEGSTGLSTGPHLHFEVRVNGTVVNPLPYLTAG